MSAFYDLASLVVVPSGYKASKVYAQKPLTTDGQLSFSRASTATRVNSAGLIETVSSNVPRLDYLGSNCPKLLLEPQRTNLLQFSEQFDNAYWTKTNVTITANAAVSPDGNQNADLIVPTAGSSSKGLDRSNVFTADGVARTWSLYVKAAGYRYIAMGEGSITDNSLIFDAINGVYTQNGTLPYYTSRISPVNMGNGWWRIGYTTDLNSAFYDNFKIFVTNSPTGAAASAWNANGTDGVLIWGAQLEQGAYPTSLINTTSAAVTRLADACSKTGITSLIGQTEGTVLIDVTGPSKHGDARYMSVSNGTDAHRIVIYSNGATTAAVYLQNPTGGAIQIGFNTVNGRMKIACGYKNNDVVVYVNGVNVGAINSYNPAFTFNFVGVGTYENNTIPNSLGQGVNQALVFKTRLTNAQLAELTAL